MTDSLMQFLLRRLRQEHAYSNALKKLEQDRATSQSADVAHTNSDILRNDPSWLSWDDSE